MDAALLNGIVLTLLAIAVFFYILHGVIRSAVRGALTDARREAAEQAEPHDAGSP